MNLFLALIAALWIGGRAEVHHFESIAAADIASRLAGPRKLVSVNADVGPEAIFGDVHSVTIHASRFETDGIPLFTEPERSKRGILRKLKLDMADFQIGGLHVQTLQADLTDSRFDIALALRHGQIRLSRSGEGPGAVVISAHDLAEFIKLKFHEISSITVSLEHDKIVVEGHGEFILFDADFWLVAKLEAVDGAKLVMSFAHVLIDGRPASAAAEKALLDTLNPIIDLNQDLGLHGAMRVDRIEASDGTLRALGPIHIPARPKVLSEFGAGNAIRTRDLLLGKEALYH
jgi:hypothetical protein